MEVIFEIIFEVILEFLVPTFFELLGELVVREVGKTTGWRRPNSSLLAGLGYIFLAAFGAGLSLVYFPEHFIENSDLRMLTLFVTPIAVGLVMSLRGKFLSKKGKPTIRLDSFSYGFLFALVFGLIRFWFAK